jgi:hypothetical protein
MEESFRRRFFMSNFAVGLQRHTLSPGQRKAGQLDPTEHYSLNKKSYEEENKEKE